MGFDGILTSVFIPLEISPDKNLMKKKTLRAVEIRRHAKYHRSDEAGKEIIYLGWVHFWKSGLALFLYTSGLAAVGLPFICSFTFNVQKTDTKECITSSKGILSVSAALE